MVNYEKKIMEVPSFNVDFEKMGSSWNSTTKKRQWTFGKTPFLTRLAVFGPLDLAGSRGPVYHGLGKKHMVRSRRSTPKSHSIWAWYRGVIRISRTYGSSRCADKEKASLRTMPLGTANRSWDRTSENLKKTSSHHFFGQGPTLGCFFVVILGPGVLILLITCWH